MIDPNLANLLIGTVSSVIGNKISDYLKFNPNPTRGGIVSILAENYGSEITAENVSIKADKILDIIVKNGGKISLREGSYRSGGASIEIGKGARIDMNGDAGIKMS